MKQHVIAAAAAVTLAGAVTTAAIPLAQAATPTAPATTTFILRAVTKANTRVPHGGVETDVIENQSGAAIGADSLICHVSSPQAPPKCAVSFSLPGGYLFFSVTGTKTGAAGPLVAGTGRYAHTTGKVTATGISRTRTKVIITLHR